MKKILALCILLTTILIHCSEYSNKEKHKDKTNETVNFTIQINGDTVSTGTLALMEDNELIKYINAPSAGSFTMENISIYNADGTPKSYQIYYYIDSNSNSLIDTDEDWSKVLLDTIEIQNISNDSVINPYTLILYEGIVKFHDDMTSGILTSNSKYLFLKKNDSHSRTIPVNADDSFSFVEKSKNEQDYDIQTYYDLYAFYDDFDGDGSGDGVMDEFQDPVAFLQTLNANYSIYISTELKHVSGAVQFTPVSGTEQIYPFTSTVNPPIIKIEDQNYWRSIYQKYHDPVYNSGTNTASLSVFVPAGRLIDITMYHVQSNIEDFNTEAKKKLIMPVQLTGTYAYDMDTVLHSIDDINSPIKIHTISGTLRRNATADTNGNIIVVAGDRPITYDLYKFENNVFLDNSPVKTNDLSSTEDTTFYIFFREYDRTTATDGAQHDATIDTNFTGYGPFFSLKFAIDTNYDMMYVSGEPVSETLYYGDDQNYPTIDLDGSDDTTDDIIAAPDGIPDWEPGGTGDYDDAAHPSHINENKLNISSFEIK